MSDNPSIVPQGKFRFWDFAEKRHYYTDKIEQLSPTSIKDGLECSWKVYFKCTTDIKPPKSVPLVSGSIFHSVCETYLRNRAQDKPDLTWQKLLGVFEAAVIHYAVAKIFGPLLFGRGWCGYACWTAMVLDLMPYKVPQKPRKKLGFIRYIVFSLSLLFVGGLFLLKVQNIEKIMFWSFIIGNALYYGVGITLAVVMKDNRAFCKYVCPITVFLKPASYFSLLRVKNDKDKCVSCGKCKKICPMNVDMTDNSRKRVNGTECILCFKCIDECPKKSLHI